MSMVQRKLYKRYSPNIVVGNAFIRKKDFIFFLSNIVVLIYLLPLVLPKLPVAFTGMVEFAVIHAVQVETWPQNLIYLTSLQETTVVSYLYHTGMYIPSGEKRFTACCL